MKVMRKTKEDLIQDINVYSKTIEDLNTTIRKMESSIEAMVGERNATIIENKALLEANELLEKRIVSFRRELIRVTLNKVEDGIQ